MIAHLHRLGLIRIDKALPAHHVGAGWLPRRWLVVCIVVALCVAQAAAFAWLYQRERAQVEALLAEQDKIEQRITVVFDGDGVVCKVPAAREKVAPLVHNACQMLTRWIAAEGVIK